MTEQRQILVTGATGNVGGRVVSQLPGRGAAVRAFVRDPDSAGVEAVRGDLSAPETLEAGLGGVDSVFLVWPFLSAEGAPAVVDGIAAHARRVVYLSSEGVKDGAGEQTDPINGFHAELGRHVGRDPSWHGGGVGQEGAEESDRAELRPETEPVAVPAAPADQAQVLVVEVEEAGELLFGRLARKEAVGAPP